MSTEGPITPKYNINDYTEILNLYLRCPKGEEVSLMYFANDYREKVEYATEYLRNYNEDIESVKKIARNIVDSYCLSKKYSILEDSTLVFQTFMEEYFHNLKMVADILNGTLNQGVAR